jgi:type I restriction enzyme S subunit
VSFPRYPAYKPSGVEWLGEVPAHWSLSRLGYICKKIGSGKTPSGGSDTYCADGVVFIRSQNVYDEGLFLDDVVYITAETDEEMAGTRVHGGDILLNITGASLGRTCVVPSEFAPANVNQHVCIIRLIDGPSRAFVAMAMKSEETKSQINATQNGAAREGLNFTQVSKLVLPCLPPAEQALIATFLEDETSKIDALIAEQERLIALLAEKRQAMISQAVTKGLNAAAPMKDSGSEWLGNVPAHWETGPLKRYWTVTDCKHVTAEFVQDGIPLASIREVQSWWVNLDGAKCTTPYFYEVLTEGGRKPSPGDLVFSRNATVGEVAQVNDVHPAFAMGQDVVLLRKISAEYSSDYFQHVVRSPVIAEQLANLMIGSTFKRINVEEIRSLSVPMPPAAEQARIAVFLQDETSRMDALTAEAQRAIELLRERRSALISAAVTGQIDVRGAEAS